MTGGWNATFRQALIAAIIGFLTIAASFMITDAIAGRPLLYTAGVLGFALFGGADITEASTSIGLVLGYTAVHFAAFLLFGLVAAMLARLADRGWQLWYVGLFLMLFVGFHLFAAVQGFAAPTRAAISVPMIWIAGFAASALMAFYLLRAHPRIRGPQSW